MLAKFLLPLIAVLLLFGLTLNAAAEVLQPLPLLLRILGMLMTVVMFFYVIGKLIKFVLLHVFAKLTKDVTASLPANVRGEFMDVRFAPFPYLDMTETFGVRERSDEALKLSFRFAGVDGSATGQLEPSGFSLMALGGASRTSAYFSSNARVGPQSILEMMQGLQNQMAGEVFKAEWIRVSDRNGVELVSISSGDETGGVPGLPPLAQESMIELYFSRHCVNQGTDFVLRYGMMKLFSFDASLLRGAGVAERPQLGDRQG